MELKNWLLAVRIINIIASLLMVGFEVWFIIDLLQSDASLVTIIVRLFAPAFVILLAIVIITSEFKFPTIVEHFKFLQFIPGLALFDLFIGSILAFQFSTVSLSWAAGLAAGIFLGLAIVTFIFGCLRPAGAESLLSAED